MTAPHPLPTQDDQLLELRERLAAIDEQISGLTEARKALALQVVELAGGALGKLTTSTGAEAFVLSSRRTFNAERARDLFASNPALIEQISETVISSKKAKAILPPAAYEACMVASENITVKPAAVA